MVNGYVGSARKVNQKVTMRKEKEEKLEKRERMEKINKRELKIVQ